MSGTKIDIGKLSSAVMEGLEDYAKMSTESMKKAVRKSANLCKNEIIQNAPVKTGKYKDSWKTSTTGEDSNSLQITVHSKRYWLPHLLEFGHVTRNGGRVQGKAHIAPAEEKAAKQLEDDIKKALGG